MVIFELVARVQDDRCGVVVVARDVGVLVGVLVFLHDLRENDLRLLLRLVSRLRRRRRRRRRNWDLWPGDLLRLQRWEWGLNDRWSLGLNLRNLRNGLGLRNVKRRVVGTVDVAELLKIFLLRP